jgi:predicted DCC family thiol-disulfide oxidoreductase YuxK
VLWAAGVQASPLGKAVAVATGAELEMQVVKKRQAPEYIVESEAERMSSVAYVIEVFFDGGCPLCRREINLLRRWDQRGKIRFTDISSPDFQAAEVGKTDDVLMAQMHGRLPDGTWLQGVEVFRRLYAAVGFGPLVFLSRLPLISQLLDWSYAVFARNRLRLTGRCTSKSCSAKPD